MASFPLYDTFFLLLFYPEKFIICSVISKKVGKKLGTKKLGTKKLFNTPLKGGGGGGGSGLSVWTNDFELGVGGEGQDTSQNLEGSFGSIRALLPK